MDANIYIACLRQVVAFAPKAIKCDAYGACEQIYLKVFGADHEETLDAAMRALTVGEEEEDEEGEEEDSDRGEEEDQAGDSGER